MTTPHQTDVLNEVFESKFLDINTAGPGRIESYNESTRTADIQLMIRRPLPNYEDEFTFETITKLPNVPILMIYGGSFSLTYKLQKGDFVLVIACSLSIGQWRETGSISNPSDLRKHDWSNAVAIAGLTPITKSLPFDPSAALIEGTLKVGAAAKALVKESELLVELGKIASAINGIAPGSYTPPGPGVIGTLKLLGE